MSGGIGPTTGGRPHATFKKMELPKHKIDELKQNLQEVMELQKELIRCGPWNDEDMQECFNRAYGLGIKHGHKLEKP